MNEAASFHFEVLSGLYAGLSGKAAGRASLIGSGFDADMIFVEQELEPHHLRVTLVGNSIEIEALAAISTSAGEGQVAAGERVVHSLPVVVHAGAMSIRWSMQNAVVDSSVGLSRASISALAIVLIGVVAIGAFSTVFFKVSAGVQSANAPPAAELAPKLRIVRPNDRHAQDAAELLKQEVVKAGLLDIRVGSGPGFVSAEGTVTPATLAKWQELQQRFDGHTNGALTLVNGVLVKEDKQPSAIPLEAVWRGEQPYLLIGGQKYFVGALLADGWSVDRIEEGRVLLSRNGRFAALAY
ncbi:FHA domain-containing protein [Bradyrhizobium arachidis]|uniref:FHA domain-containing protein n=1 Tax=Bradyrhizobium arachidis TaxID=858423 RepID=UPI002161867A|nr:FHA domain-containing protein [Bradyrhizobium arachidis]UVO30278.1 FHA domain-containing protein [Bradyrhizobium arachidis]